MNDTTQILNELGIFIPKILLPQGEIDLGKWSVIACDQFTSDPQYWERVKATVADSPSTLNLIFPEAYLELPDKADRIKKINQVMRNYLSQGTLKEAFEGFVAVERTMAQGKIRKGLVLALDLEAYEYEPGKKSLIRATEGTVLDRIPPRLEIRKDAPIELPHIMVLVDNPQKALIEPLFETVKKDAPLYDFDLMCGGGHLRGYAIKEENTLTSFAESLGTLFTQAPDGLLFAMGDGNHSLATAKAHWNNVKKTISEDAQTNHPARFALVELVNLHDDGLHFEAIHRVVTGVNPKELWDFLSKRRISPIPQPSTCLPARQGLGSLNLEGYSLAKLGGTEQAPKVVALLQDALDDFLKSHPQAKIDYIHGEDAVRQLATKNDTVGFILPAMDKKDLFPYVAAHGALPRKTFSMGEAEEKRYYLEAKSITLDFSV